MGKCSTCHIEILDETEYCPLCHSVLTPTDELENIYPNVRLRIRHLLLFSRIYLFAAILLEATLFCVNLLTESTIWWSAITGLGLLSGYLVLRYAILGKSGHRSKIFILTLFAILFAVAIDYVIGYQGWSVDYVLPAGILVADASIIGCMIYNRRNWQSYIMAQILTILCSILPALFFIFGLERNPYWAFSPLAASVALFLGTIIIGDRRAMLELKRRFHIY